MGYGSRRACEQLIEQGRVSVNGEVVRIGAKAEQGVDLIALDGVRIRSDLKRIYIILNKPRGVLSSLRSQGGDPTVIDMVGLDERVYPVGRLDKESEGLILLTNDGELTERVTHPRYAHEKEYRVRLDRRISEEHLHIWAEGIVLPDGYRSQPIQIMRQPAGRSSNWIHVILREGRKRQIREAARVLGYRVKRLIRTSLLSLELGDLETGAWRYLEPEEVDALRAATGLEKAGSFVRSRTHRRQG
jgi:23S rRNA pseudouridine2605 synthase